MSGSSTNFRKRVFTEFESNICQDLHRVSSRDLFIDSGDLSICTQCALLHGSRCGRGCPNPTGAYATTTEVRTEFGRAALPVIGAVGRDLAYCMFDPIKQWANLGWVIYVLLCQHRATIRPVLASTARCSFLQLRQDFWPRFSCSHSPAPKTFSPVLSINRCADPSGNVHRFEIDFQ